MIHSLFITSFLFSALSVSVIASEKTELDDAAKREASLRYLAEQRKKLEDLKVSQLKEQNCTTPTHQSPLYAPLPILPEDSMEFFLRLDQSETHQLHDEALANIIKKAKKILDTLNKERTWGNASQQSAQLVMLIASHNTPQSVKNDASIQELREKLLTFNTLTENLTRAKKTRLHNSNCIPVKGPQKKQEELNAETAFKHWFYAYESFLQKL